MLEVRQAADGVSFRVRVAPRAARSAICGEHDGALKISITAAPVDGEANAALCELLAKALGVPKRAVQVSHGERGRLKTLRVAGVSCAAIHALISDSSPP